MSNLFILLTINFLIATINYYLIFFNPDIRPIQMAWLTGNNGSPILTRI